MGCALDLDLLIQSSIKLHPCGSSSQPSCSWHKQSEKATADAVCSMLLIAANVLAGIPDCTEAAKQFRALKGEELHGGQQSRGDVSYVGSLYTICGDFLKQSGNKMF